MVIVTQKEKNPIFLPDRHVRESLPEVGGSAGTMASRGAVR